MDFPWRSLTNAMREHQIAGDSHQGKAAFAPNDSGHTCPVQHRQLLANKGLLMPLSRKNPLPGRKPSSARAGRPRLLLEQLEDRLVPSTLIPVSNRRDLVYDQSRGLLYMTT